jgi:hypothetical protein
MQITLDTNNLSDLDVQILSLIMSSEPTAEKPKATTVAKPAAKKPEPEPEAEAEAEAEVEPEADGVSLADAKALASKMVANGEAAKVKAALTKVGAKKVSEVSEDKVAEFHSALSAS